MTYRTSSRLSVWRALLASGMINCSSAGGIEGKYYNSSSGEFAMERMLSSPRGMASSS